jgi:RNA recognition motif. (a.k.a. RRM, RBD, or RNP domain)
MAATAHARIYIGGLDPEVATADVVGRFAPFGAVAGCELVPAKAGAAPGGSCRGFAYVDFIPHNEAALARVFSLVRAAWRLALRRARPILLCVVIPGPLEAHCSVHAAHPPMLLRHPAVRGCSTMAACGVVAGYVWS